MAMRGIKMPSGKELEQLPVNNTTLGMGENRGPFEKETLKSFVEEVHPKQSQAGTKNRRG